MALDVNRVRSAFDALPVVADSAFRRIVTEGRLRHDGAQGAPDIVDAYSARLVCSVLRSSEVGPALLVLPDDVERRASLLFSAPLVMDGLAQLRTDTVGRCVLYVSSHPAVRSQLRNIRLGSTNLDGIFEQQYGRGRAEDLRPMSLPGGVHLPAVFCLCAPADPAGLMRQLKPNWVAVDCGNSHDLTWLPSLLFEATRAHVPVVGWTAKPFSRVIDQWLEAGGGVFRWPRLRSAAGSHIANIEQLSAAALESVITPRILTGEHVRNVSKAFATATEALLAARAFQDGRLSADAVMLGWKYLRAMESVPVPLEVYEREANSYWGMRRIADLRDNFARFVDAVHPLSGQLHATLQDVAEALSCAHAELLSGESPLWLGLANLCIESTGRRRIVFTSKSRREMFSFCLLARFNISEDDLKEVGVRLAHASEAEQAGAGDDNSEAGSLERAEAAPPLLVGMPSGFTEKYLDTLLDSGQLEVLLWPHQEAVLERRVRHLSSKLRFDSQRLGRLLPTIEGQQAYAREEGVGESYALSLARSRKATAGALGDELRLKAEVVSLWEQPDAAEAIAGLFGSVAQNEDEEGYAPITVLEDGASESGTEVTADSIWVQDALELHLEGGLRLLLPSDEPINVIVRNARGAQVEPRYVRSLRAGDEILFIQGQRRQGLYELLVSRVHRDPVIAQYLALVRRWQDDFVRAFTEAERQGKTSPESMLVELQKRGSRLTSPLTIRSWSRRLVLAPNDPEDLRRMAEVLSLGFVQSYCTQINTAGKRLKGLHISLSARLNRWLASNEAERVAAGNADEVIDAELGLTMEDFCHSLLRVRVLRVQQQRGPFYRPHMGRLEGGTS